MGYRRPPRAQTVAPMSQGLRVLVLQMRKFSPESDAEEEYIK
jgi:hypothetical protein